MALKAGMCAACALFPAIAYAQDQGGPDDQGQEDAAAEEQAAPVPVSQSLNDLIPESAVANAADWAAQGVANPAGPEADIEVVSDAVEDAVEAGLDTADIIAFDDFEIPEPARLEPDPEVTALASIDAPDLIELPELEEFEISDELVLAFPADQIGFPQQASFIERFKALSTIRALESGDDTVPQLAARARADEELLAEILRTYGYYGGEVVRQLSGGVRGGDSPDRSEGADPKVRFDILPGDQFAFGAIDLGALDYAPDYDALRDAFEIRSGDPLLADKIVEEEADLRLALGETGYPFALIDPPDLLVDHARKEGDLELFVDPGEKYVFAGVTSEDEDFLSNRHLGRIARFREGDVYKASLQADLRRAILATGLVTSVSVTPREVTPATADAPGEVTMDVDFEKAPLRTIAGAIGFGTEDGFKLEASWEHRNLFPSEGGLKLRGILGTQEQLASVTFKKNNFRGRDQVLTLDAYASDIETEAVDARTVAVRAAFERISNLLFQKPLSWQIGAEALYTDERNRVINGIERPRQTYTIFGLFGSATLDSSDDLLDPTEGYRLTAFAAPEISRSEGQQSVYLRAQGDASYYQSVGSTVLAGRARFATIQGAAPADIAPSRRIYAGGGGSVRGYGFQGIGPRNDLGEPTGGGSLVELSLEARIQTGLLDGAVEVVPFVDAGTVSLGSTPDFRFIQYGAGVGIRYKTSFGPIRVDVGTPINPTEFDAPVVVYVSLGQAF